jgi:2-polyprenyl-3-methyl-5-hydroxy-6-metoxy-1,4-benzoquinol methylase
MPDAACCPLCGCCDHEVMFDLRAVSKALSVPGIVARCRRCPMWFKIITDPARLDQAYGDDYATVDGADQYLAGEAARELFRKTLSEIRVTNGAARRLLDIGAGQGVLLEEARRIGYEAEGIDVCEALVRKAQARGLSVACMRAEDLDARECFDVVTMTDVIEHVPAPRRLLASAHRALKPGGRLIVYTPNHRGAVVTLGTVLHRIGARFAVREIFGGNHVCFFDDRSLPLALDREGFQVNAVRLFPYDPSRPGGAVSPVSLAVVTAVEWLGRPFNRMFRMLAFATKQHEHVRAKG